MKIATIIRAYPWLPAIALIAIVLGGCDLQPSPRISADAEPMFKALAHWRHNGHDWLVVVDGKADEVRVYNAVDGRPVQRMRLSQELHDVGALMQRDGRLFVVGRDGALAELRLSPREIAFADRR